MERKHNDLQESILQLKESKLKSKIVKDELVNEFQIKEETVEESNQVIIKDLIQNELVHTSLLDKINLSSKPIIKETNRSEQVIPNTDKFNIADYTPKI